MSPLFRHTFLSLWLGALLFAAVPVQSAGQDSAPPPALVRFARDAGAAGLSDAQIRDKALQAGWTDAVVTQVLAYVHRDPAVTAEVRADPSVPSPGSAAPVAPRPQATRPKTPNSVEDYRIGAGDVLEISVWKERDVSVPSIIVRPDGKITLPLVKDLDVAGFTPAEVEQKITERLASYIPTADVTVVVTAPNSKRIYVLGAVKKEGTIAYTYRMTAMQAIAEAGGLTDYAKRKKIYVLRTENGRERKILFNYDSVLNGKLVDYIVLKPNDTVVVPH